MGQAVSPHRPELLPAWQTLSQLAQAGMPMLRELASAPDREQWQWQAAGLSLDARFQSANRAVLECLLALAEQAQVTTRRDAMFRGEAINLTEDRAVLHVALRGDAEQVGPWGATVHRQVHDELSRVLAFAERVRDGDVSGWRGEPIRHVVNLGIGGSDLGPRMATEALAPWVSESVVVHYVSNPDAWALHEVLQRCEPSRTLVIIASKTFTTQETLTNAASARRWLMDNGCPADQLGAQCVAVTAAPTRSAAMGIAPEHTFTFWDWVGGRYSVWSSLGLPLAIAVGAQAFRALLAGARAMDRHFCEAPLASNLPVLMALFGIWNRNFLGCPTHLLVPYASRLARFTAFIQQMDMESNGKRVGLDGLPVAVDTGPIVWGGLGIDGQHAYFQLLHQGRHRIPVEFVGVRHEDTPLPLAAEHQRVVQLNLRAQAEALAFGRTVDETEALLASGLSGPARQAMANHRSFPGNVPSVQVWLERLDPQGLGALIALHEHRVFVQGAIWGINSYDQWGVELGKTLAQAIEREQR